MGQHNVLVVVQDHVTASAEIHCYTISFFLSPASLGWRHDLRVQCDLGVTKPGLQWAKGAVGSDAEEYKGSTRHLLGLMFTCLTVFLTAGLPW